MSQPTNRSAVISSKFRDDLRNWIETDRKAARLVLDLMAAILADPFEGVGKPEPLKHELAGCWRRRITQEHRIVCHITENWRGRPWVSHEIIIQLIVNATTKAGLKIRAELDPRRDPTGTQISDAELASLNLKRSDFHGEWNYTLLPSRQ